MPSNAVPIPHRFSVSDFHRLGELGFFGEDEHIELIEGKLIDMAPIGSEHASLLGYLTVLMARAIGDGVVLYPQNPLRLADDCECYPDLMLLKPRGDRYAKRIPVAGDVFLVVEIAKSSLRYDRDTKIPLYAKYGVPETWLFDIGRREAAVYREPSPEGYRAILKPLRTDAIAPLALPEVRIHLDDIWR